MSIPSSVFIAIRGDTRSGDLLSSMKVFLTPEKAQEYAMQMREKHPDCTTFVAVQETELIP